MSYIYGKIISEKNKGNREEWKMDRYSHSWAEASSIIDYAYPEDLCRWNNDYKEGIAVDSPVLDRLRPGDAVYISNDPFSFMYAFEILRLPIRNYAPIALLSMSEDMKERLNDLLFSLLEEDFDSDEKIVERLSSRSVLSKKLRARRFCDVEDELMELSEKGYKTVLLSSFDELPYIDAESKEKGYGNHHDAISSIARAYGMSLILISAEVPERKDGAICLHVKPVKNKLLFMLREYVIVDRDGIQQVKLRFHSGGSVVGCFSIGDRIVSIERKEE